LYKG
jgi:DNA polymerase elongation subunit (family B)